MKTASIQFLRAGIDADEFLLGIRDLFLSAFPGQILSIYLLGSRAVGCEISTSDVDLAVIFHGGAGAAKRPEVRQFLGALLVVSPMPMDILVLDAEEVRKGVKPHLKTGRALVGPDLLKDCPLKAKAELLLYDAGSAAYFIRAVRNNPKALRYPLDYPVQTGEFYGYELNGIRVADGQYQPGFSTLLNLINRVANFRLAWHTGVFSFHKSQTVALYQKHLPADPWLKMIEEMYEICRIRLEGRVPEAGPERSIISNWCRRVLEFENEFLGICIDNLESFVAIDNPDLKHQIRDFINTLESDAPPQSAILAEIKGRLAGSPA